MTEAEIVYDLMMEAEGMRLSDDARLDEYDYVAYLMREKRARTIRDTYRRNKTIYSELLQKIYNIELTKVDLADNSIDLYSDLLGKAKIPPIIGFHEDTSELSLGINRLSYVNSRNRIYQTSINKLELILELNNSRKELFEYFCKIGNEIFVYPFKEKINLVAILENPLDGYIHDNEYKTILSNGIEYTVINGSINYNTVTYQLGDKFIANAVTSFTGNGKVVLSNPIRKMTKNDPYPITAGMLKQIKIELLNTEFRLEGTQQTDSRNDSADSGIIKEQE